MGNDNVIRFPGTYDHPRPLFHVTDQGTLQIEEEDPEGAARQFWEVVQHEVRQAWMGTPLAYEQARVRLLVGYLDRVLPGWRKAMHWDEM